MTTRQDITTLYERATTLLHAEEVAPPPTGLSDWQERQARRALLETHIQELDLTITELRRRFDDLPKVASAEHVRWASALFAFPNLAFLEVDTDGLSADADILRIALIDQAGAVLFDQLIQPRRPISPKIAHLTALGQEHLTDAPRLPDVWEAVTQAVTGRFILSFNLEFDQQQLAENARRYSLPPLNFIGACLMLRAQDYYEEEYYPRLSALCDRLGLPLPPHPQQDALDRARGQVHLLRMMAQGITHVPTAQQVFDGAESSDAGDPFLPDVPDEDE
jgi:DNA polymerase III epsilon subunit-like protein